MSHITDEGGRTCVGHHQMDIIIGQKWIIKNQSRQVYGKKIMDHAETKQTGCIFISESSTTSWGVNHNFLQGLIHGNPHKKYNIAWNMHLQLGVKGKVRDSMQQKLNTKWCIRQVQYFTNIAT